MDGKRNSNQLAAWADGCSIETIEGVANRGGLDAAARLRRNDGPQCGFCTSGQLMSALAFIE
jgi:aerobic-type carbon monoxide dehydrogenase small subunit (CoxS/CutS family)